MCSMIWGKAVCRRDWGSDPSVTVAGSGDTSPFRGGLSVTARAEGAPSEDTRCDEGITPLQIEQSPTAGRRVARGLAHAKETRSSVLRLARDLIRRFAPPVHLAVRGEGICRAIRESPLQRTAGPIQGSCPARKTEAGDWRVAKCIVIASQCRNTGVAIRFPAWRAADSHTSDVGHWFGMTGFCILQRGPPFLRKKQFRSLRKYLTIFIIPYKI